MAQNSGLFSRASCTRLLPPLLLQCSGPGQHGAQLPSHWPPLGPAPSCMRPLRDARPPLLGPWAHTAPHLAPGRTAFLPAWFLQRWPAAPSSQAEVSFGNRSACCFLGGLSLPHGITTTPPPSEHISTAPRTGWDLAADIWGSVSGMLSSSAFRSTHSVSVPQAPFPDSSAQQDRQGKSGTPPHAGAWTPPPAVSGRKAACTPLVSFSQGPSPGCLLPSPESGCLTDSAQFAVVPNRRAIALAAHPCWVEAKVTLLTYF